MEKVTEVAKPSKVSQIPDDIFIQMMQARTPSLALMKDTSTPVKYERDKLNDR